MKIKLKILLFCFIAFTFIGCDQITKDMAKEHLMNKTPIVYLHGLFTLEYVENTGAALSLGDQLPQPYSFILLSMIPLVFLTVVFVYSIRHIKEFDTLRLISLALIFAGGIGNIIDRILHDRHVTDFMNMGVQQFRTGIFNMADIGVTAGVIGMFISLYTSKTNPVQTG